MLAKLTTLSEAVSTISSGSRIALGGNTLHRGPCAAVHEIVRQGIGDLELIKTAGAYDVDLLAAMGLATSVSAGFVGFETVYGMAPNYRRAVESGLVETKEHACYSVIAGLRAAIQGVPFMPIAGMFGSDLLDARGFKTITDPYAGESVVAVPALVPDVAIIHVQEADEARQRTYRRNAIRRRLDGAGREASDRHRGANRGWLVVRSDSRDRRHPRIHGRRGCRSASRRLAM